MISCDVNVLVYAYNQDERRSADYRRWLEDAVNGPEPFGLSSMVVSGFLRVVTHPKVLVAPIDTDTALDLVAELRQGPAVVPMEPGGRHWTIFESLCRAVGAKGNAVPDTYLAALAVEHGCTWYSADRGFTRFPGLQFRQPLDSTP